MWCVSDWASLQLKMQMQACCRTYRVRRAAPSGHHPLRLSVRTSLFLIGRIERYGSWQCTALVPSPELDQPCCCRWCVHLAPSVGGRANTYALFPAFAHAFHAKSWQPTDGRGTLCIMVRLQVRRVVLYMARLVPRFGADCVSPLQRGKALRRTNDAIAHLHPQ